MSEMTPHMKKRHAAERRFRWYGRLAVLFALFMLGVLVVSILGPAYNGFRQTEVEVTVAVPQSLPEDKGALHRMGMKLSRDAFASLFPPLEDRAAKRELLLMLSKSAGLRVMRALEHATPGESLSIWVPTSDIVDQVAKGKVSHATPVSERRVTDQQITWTEELREKGKLRTRFNPYFFSNGDSRQPEKAGFLGGVIGSLFTLLVCMSVAFPIGVMAAIYLEELSSKGRMRDIIEVNINNLAAVPSIVYGLLGVALWLNFIGLPRSAPIVGGLTLALMTLPVVIISTRLSLRAVPDSIRQAALGLGATKMQAVFHHVLPLAMPGIMTGTILGLARAIGETAPLLMIGMVAFIVDLPHGILSPSTVMPVQIYLWSSSPEAGFADKTSAGIAVLIAILLVMNALAIWIRKRYEQRW